MALKLHLGCGKRHLPGFVHVDLGDFPHLDHRCRIDRLPMFGDATAELIYCCHAFQYFDRTQARAALDEWRRILRPGGILRLAVPDFEALVSVFALTRRLADILGPLYGRMAMRATDGERTIYHRTVYDFESLARLLEESGFGSVRRYEWRDTIHRDFDDYSQAYKLPDDKARGTLISLNVEAIR